MIEENGMKVGNFMLICGAILLSSCMSTHNLRGYKLPDTASADADENTRAEAYEADKLTYGPIPGMFFFGPDVFLQEGLITKKDVALKTALISPLHFSLVPVPKDRFPPDRVVVEELFRLDDTAHSKYVKGRYFETTEKIGKAGAGLGLGVAAGVGFIAVIDLLLTAWGSSEEDTGRGDRFNAYERAIIGGGIVFLGGLTVRVGFGIARHAAYSGAASSYNEYLQSLYELHDRH
jgi:hypothetical protein